MAEAFAAGALDFFQFLIGLPKQAYINFTRNSVEMWDGMTPLKYIRLVAILGAYLFLRPYLQKWGERTQAKQHEKELSKAEMDAANGKKAKISPNALRGATGGKTVKWEDEKEAEGEAEDEGADGGEWGKKARRRQRKFVEKVLEGEEAERRAREGDEDDKDIFEHLVDYEEGEDGW